jgi:hypothetical protein
MAARPENHIAKRVLEFWRLRASNITQMNRAMTIPSAVLLSTLPAKISAKACQ